MAVSGLHVVFGAGAVGRALANMLVSRGQRVTVVSRGRHRGDPVAAQYLTGDVRDPRFAALAARGAVVVYQVLNPGYHHWAGEFPALQASVLAAARATGARLVTLENTYMYGRPDGHPFTEDHPHNAHTRKGRLRAQLSLELLAAHDVEVVIGRASDYFGPGGGAQSPLGDRVVPAVLAGRTAQVLGDPDLPHTYSFIPDIARGLAVLGEHPAAPGRIWHLPNDPDTRTTRSILQTLSRLAGHPDVKVRSIPPALLRVVGLVDKAAGEAVEMLYQFNEPFVVDSTMIDRELGVHATPLDDALAATLDSYRPPADRLGVVGSGRGECGAPSPGPVDLAVDQRPVGAFDTEVLGRGHEPVSRVLQ